MHLAVWALVLALVPGAALADWDGSPKGGPDQTPGTASGSHNNCWLTSTLDPAPARQMDDCPWLHNALEAQNMDGDHGWTITFAADLPGVITIDEYYAWVEEMPPVTNRHGTTYPGTAEGCIGGAVLDLNYDVVPPNPAMRWIQVIRTDAPTPHGQANGYDEPGTDYYQYIDNGGNPAGDPFYDPVHTAGSDWFIDTPWRECACPPCNFNCDWEAQLFMATGDPQTHTLTIYDDGVWWGFDFSCIPEPSTLFLLLAAVAGLSARRRPAA